MRCAWQSARARSGSGLTSEYRPVVHIVRGGFLGDTWGFGSLRWRCNAYPLAFDVEVVISHVGIVRCGRRCLCKGNGSGSRATRNGEIEEDAASHHGHDISVRCVLGDVEQLDGTKDGLLSKGEIADGLIQRLVGLFIIIVIFIIIDASVDARVLKGVVGGGARNVAPMLTAQK